MATYSSTQQVRRHGHVEARVPQPDGASLGPCSGAGPARDRDVRNAIRAALLATEAFDACPLSMAFEVPTSQFTAAVVEPISGVQNDPWDSQPGGGLVVTSTVRITFLARHDDPQLRDELVEDLFNTSANALNGQSLACLTLPGLTRFASWNWQPETPPERRIVAMFSYQYIVEGWDSYDETA